MPTQKPSSASDSQLSRRRLLQCGAAAGAGLYLGAGAAKTRGAKQAATLRVMTYNILNGGTELGTLEQTALVIQRANADLIGVQEAKDSGPRLAKLCGLHWHKQEGNGCGVLSRFPIVEHDPQHCGACVQLPDERRVWLMNCHLPPNPYQPYQLAQIPYGEDNPFIETAAEAIAEAIRARGAQLARLLMAIGRAERLAAPVFVTGDFNEPSHLDWTPRAAARKRCTLPVAWPTSRALVDAGLVDSYRAVHPDELRQPGLTWTPTPAEQDVMDRIDLVYHSSRGVTCRTAEIVGEKQSTSDIVVAPYPSDHRAVVCEFEL
ncbi:MAG: endonuclease/exonuclease/phosphatase family protein [Pirellulales bacterium]